VVQLSEGERRSTLRSTGERHDGARLGYPENVGLVRCTTCTPNAASQHLVWTGLLRRTGEVLKRMEDVFEVSTILICTIPHHSSHPRQRLLLAFWPRKHPTPRGGRRVERWRVWNAENSVTTSAVCCSTSREVVSWRAPSSISHRDSDHGGVRPLVLWHMLLFDRNLAASTILPRVFTTRRPHANGGGSGSHLQQRKTKTHMLAEHLSNHVANHGGVPDE